MSNVLRLGLVGPISVTLKKAARRRVHVRTCHMCPCEATETLINGAVEFRLCFDCLRAQIADLVVQNAAVTFKSKKNQDESHTVAVAATFRR